MKLSKKLGVKKDIKKISNWVETSMKGSDCIFDCINFWITNIRK